MKKSAQHEKATQPPSSTEIATALSEFKKNWSSHEAAMAQKLAKKAREHAEFLRRSKEFATHRVVR